MKVNMLLVLVVALVGLGVAIGPAAWELATTKKVWGVQDGLGWPLTMDGLMIGYGTYSRWSGKELRRGVLWYVESGMKAIQVDPTSMAVFNKDGTVREQGLEGTGDLSAPPWVGGVTDEAGPSAPWFKAGLTPDEFWEQVKPYGASTLEEFINAR